MIIPNIRICLDKFIPDFDSSFDRIRQSNNFIILSKCIGVFFCTWRLQKSVLFIEWFFLIIKILPTWNLQLNSHHNHPSYLLRQEPFYLLLDKFLLMLITLWADSAVSKLLICFLFFPENKIWHFIQIVSCMECQSLFSGKIRKIFQNVICWNFYAECQALMAELFHEEKNFRKYTSKLRLSILSTFFTWHRSNFQQYYPRRMQKFNYHAIPQENTKI